MARTESIAKGGFYPTPPEIVASIISVLRLPEMSGELCIVDPCAGKGDAAVQIGKHFERSEDIRRLVSVELYTVELERERCEELRSKVRVLGWVSERAVRCGDAFALEFETQAYKQGASLLFLNPPYDLDRQAGRLEEKFLRRFTTALGEGGLLVFVVPHYALAASSETLAREYKDVVCFPFPAPAFDVFKQVVVFARRDPKLAPDETVRARILAWSEDVSALTPLTPGCASIEIQPLKYPGFSAWEMRAVDFQALLPKYRPWHVTTRKGELVPSPAGPPVEPVDGMMFRTYPIATPPRPAHIAAGIASGLFNGHRVEAPGLPPLLVKGVFDKEFVTVSEKEDKNGDVVGLVQVEQPKLVTTVLDLSTWRYHTLKPGEATGVTDVAEMTLGDLIQQYGSALMDVMDRQCPILYDPRRGTCGVELEAVNRQLFTAQDDAARAVVKLVETKGAAILLGEIGSGKTTVALTVGKTVARRMLVLCPPHLLDTWRDEARAVVPDARVMVIDEVTDVEELAATPTEGFTVAVLSRETAKLGHAWTSVRGACPRCGEAVPNCDLAKQRARCKQRTLSARGPLARAAMQLAMRLAPYAPHAPAVAYLLSNRIQLRYLERQTASLKSREWNLDPRHVRDVLVALLVAYRKRTEGFDGLKNAILMALLANPAPFDVCRAARVIAGHSHDRDAVSFARKLAAFLGPGSAEQAEILTEIKKPDGAYLFEDSRAILNGNEVMFYPLTLRRDEQGISLNEFRQGSLETMVELLRRVSSLGAFSLSEECGEPLFQAVPEPRRFPLAAYIAKRHPRLFDFLVLDEGHEYSGDGTAQELAAHRLTELGMPTLLMTGSLMNGYAASLFSNLWALSKDFRLEFEREDRMKFVNRYGYRKRIVEDRIEGKVVTFGSVTDRVERGERTIGQAPGVLPLLLFRHILPMAVTLHKADLALDLPHCTQSIAKIEATRSLLDKFNHLRDVLVRRIREDMFEEGRSGKLFGMLSELPSYLDRATEDTGNADDGSFVIRYPDGELVARADPFPASMILPKERWLLDTIAAELAEGRNVLVFGYHTNVLPRLARLIAEAIGEKVPLLQADKVPTAKRQAWIDQHVVSRRARVLVANPTTVQTGLNNLVHFATEVWMQDPACNPLVVRQAIGRVDRIGQKLETRILFPVYADTLQVTMHELLLKKIAVSISTDGLDPESALRAAGAADDGYLSGLSLGRQLWSMIESGRLADVA